MLLNQMGAGNTEDADVSQDVGKPTAEQQAQVSDTAKQITKTNPQADGKKAQEPPADPFKPVEFDPTARYYHPKTPEKVISGDEFYTTYNRGLQYDKVQSDLHKTQDINQTLQEQNEQLRNIVNEYENTQLISKLLKEQGVSQESKPNVADQSGTLDDWLTGGEGEDNMNNAPQQQQLSPQQIQKIINDAVATQFKAISEQNKQIMDESLASVRSATQAQAAQEQAFLTGNKVMETDLLTSYPNANNAEINEIVRLENARMVSAIAAADASKQGNLAVMEEQLQNAANFSNKSRSLQLKMAKENDKRQAEAEAQAQLEAITAPAESGYSEETPEWEAEFTPIERKYKREDVEKAEADIMKKAYATADTTEKLLRNYPHLKRQRDR